MGLAENFSIYKGKKVLITGHTGFKGSWLAIWLDLLGAKVIGIAFDPRTDQDNFVLSGIGNRIVDYRADIRSLAAIEKIVEKEKPEILFHLAAQPVVLDSYTDPVYTFETNVMGTVNLLEIVRKSQSLHTAIFITTDKCYENIEKEYSYVETDPMGGYDPYSSSKGAAELIISSYRRSFFKDGSKMVASARAGNVIGGGDWTPHRIMVDVVRAIGDNKTIEVRNPGATRPWQHVLEPLGGYLLLGAKMISERKYDEAWNFGPESENTVTVKELLEETIKCYGKGKWKDVSNKEKLHEANLLALDITKAKKQLGWKPLLNLKETVELTADWYKSYEHTDVYSLVVDQIKLYSQKWKSNHKN